MNLQYKFDPIRTAFYELVNNYFKELAKIFGYPENPGMPTLYDKTVESSAQLEFFERLPFRKTYWPPIQRPETWFEMIFGPTPKVEPIPRYIYENKDEGFYNFYIENYRNLFFLPDWLSEFIQIRLNICLDISILEIGREVLFIGLMVYSQVVVFRIAVSWWLSINPYRFPLSYIFALVDWTDDVLQGIVPSIIGVNLTGSVFLGMLGALADSLNHLVLTMPFLPSEGEKTKLLINAKMKDVLVFHYLPTLWYRYPIPNNLREFWYYERPDILDYMQIAYKDLDLQFLPDNIIEKLNEQNLHNEQLSQINNYTVSHTNYFTEFIIKLNSLNESLYHFLINSFTQMF